MIATIRVPDPLLEESAAAVPKTVGPVFCWELLAPDAATLSAVRQLYRTTMPLDERIPWRWLKQSLRRRLSWTPGRRNFHLLMAAAADDTSVPLGFTTATSVPGFGGYVSYLGVARQTRGRGVGTRLFEEAFRLLAVDAAAAVAPLPFIVWESHAPDPDAPVAVRANWQARLRLFERVGGFALEGVTLHAPNYLRPNRPAIPLRLFVKPVDRPAAALDASALRGVVDGLLRHIYGVEPGQALYEATLPAAASLRLIAPRDS